MWFCRSVSSTSMETLGEGQGGNWASLVFFFFFFFGLIG